jgi:hypothetical protein
VLEMGPRIPVAVVYVFVDHVGVGIVDVGAVAAGTVGVDFDVAEFVVDTVFGVADVVCKVDADDVHAVDADGRAVDADVRAVVGLVGVAADVGVVVEVIVAVADVSVGLVAT